MDITNKQHLSNLLTWLAGDMDARLLNMTGIELPAPLKAQNSKGTFSLLFSDTWGHEFRQLRKENPDNCVEAEIDGVSLFAYNFKLDGKPVHITGMDYPTRVMEGVALRPGHCKNIQAVIDSWTTNAGPDKYTQDHPIHDFIKNTKN